MMASGSMNSYLLTGQCDGDGQMEYIMINFLGLSYL